jgi:hypothetical protein
MSNVITEGDGISKMIRIDDRWVSLGSIHPTALPHIRGGEKDIGEAAAIDVIRIGLISTLVSILDARAFSGIQECHCPIV